MGASFITRLDDLAPTLRGGAVAIGNFDGVHLGHQAVLRGARERAGGGPSLALTFEPHPREAFGGAPIFRLTPEAEKARRIAELGIDMTVSLPFPPLATMSAEAFVRDVLANGLGVRHVVTGEDFRFGAKRGGDIDVLQRLGATHGFAAHTVPAVHHAGGPVSSSRVRSALGDGDVDLATALLGTPWRFGGDVVKGQQIGRTLGYPTANLVLPDRVTLKHGIYAVRVRVEGAWRDGVASYGRRPTFDNGAALFETFVFDFEGDLYGTRMEVELIAFLRPELRFGSADALVVQMDRDAAEARQALKRLPPADPA